MFVTDEEFETDREVFDCTTCPVLEAMDALLPVNRAAWELGRRLFTRFLFEAGAVPTALAWNLEDVPHAEDRVDMIERLSMIYAELYPPPPTPRSE